jgi:hypothetical protein
MRVFFCLLLFVVPGGAQTSGNGCGGSAANVASVGSGAPLPSGFMSANVAAKNIGPESRQVAQSPGQRVHPVWALAQIQPRRPATPPAIACVCGTVDASMLTGSSANQEVSILKGISGAFRFEHVLIQETKQFVSAGVASLNVAVGRPGLRGELIPAFALMSPAAPENFWFERPGPLQVTGTYDLAASFSGPSPLGNGTASKFASGSMNWEICGYNMQ